MCVCGGHSFRLKTNSDSNRNCNFSVAVVDESFDYDAIEIQPESLSTSYYAPMTA